MTFARFNALVERYREIRLADHEREDYRTGLICSHILNTIPRDPKKPIKIYLPSDIFPGYGWFKEEISSRPRNPDEIIEHYRVLNAALGGTEVELS